MVSQQFFPVVEEEKEIKLYDTNNVIIGEPVTVLFDPPQNELVTGRKPPGTQIFIRNAFERHSPGLEHVNNAKRTTTGFESTQMLFPRFTYPAFTGKMGHIFKEYRHGTG
jgi:hypothetical protein